MKSLRMMIVVAALGLALAAGPVWAQTPAPQGQKPASAPAGQKPDAPPAPIAQPAAPQHFPEGAKVAYIDLQFIASNSAEGKAATAKIQDWVKKKQAELADMDKKLQDLRNKHAQGAGVMSDQARSTLEKEIEKLARELQFAQQDAQADQQELTQNLQNEFQTRLQPVVDQVANERGLHMVFSIVDSGAIWVNRGLDITQDVMKRLDASAKTPATK